MFRGDDRIVCRNGLPCVTARRQTDPMQMTSPARLDGIGGDHRADRERTVRRRQADASDPGRATYCLRLSELARGAFPSLKCSLCNTSDGRGGHTGSEFSVMNPRSESYRSLGKLCRHQAAITTTPAAKLELLQMASEYKALADWLDRQSLINSTSDQNASG